MHLCTELRKNQQEPGSWDLLIADAAAAAAAAAGAHTHPSVRLCIDTKIQRYTDTYEQINVLALQSTAPPHCCVN